ncbi:MAG: hypothetical protein NT062_29645, partial [Proteobacteria bacterium]|nr:hypothetical protein [Pseudomonadota bacterium]
AKTTRIVIELPLSPAKVVALPAKIDCGPEVVTPTVNPWTGEREVWTDINVLFRIATIGGGS